MPSPALAGKWAWFRTTRTPANRVAVGETHVIRVLWQPTVPWTLFGLLGLLPVPVSVRTCLCAGPTGPASVTCRSAVRRPAPVGANWTCTVQDVFGASVWPVHVSALRRKFFGFAPANVTPLIGMFLLVALVILTVCTGEARPATTGFVNVTEDGVKATELGVPFPVRLTVWVGLFGSLSCTVTVADRLPLAVGTKSALMVHWSPGFRTALTQPASETEKSVGLDPPTDVEE